MTTATFKMAQALNTERTGRMRLRRLREPRSPDWFAIGLGPWGEQVIAAARAAFATGAFTSETRLLTISESPDLFQEAALKVQGRDGVQVSESVSVEPRIILILADNEALTVTEPTVDADADCGETRLLPWRFEDVLDRVWPAAKESLALLADGRDCRLLLVQPNGSGIRVPNFDRHEHDGLHGRFVIANRYRGWRLYPNQQVEITAALLRGDVVRELADFSDASGGVPLRLGFAGGWMPSGRLASVAVSRWAESAMELIGQERVVLPVDRQISTTETTANVLWSPEIMAQLESRMAGLATRWLTRIPSRVPVSSDVPMNPHSSPDCELPGYLVDEVSSTAREIFRRIRQRLDETFLCGRDQVPLALRAAEATLSHLVCEQSRLCREGSLFAEREQSELATIRNRQATAPGIVSRLLSPRLTRQHRQANEQAVSRLARTRRTILTQRLVLLALEAICNDLQAWLDDRHHMLTTLRKSLAVRANRLRPGSDSFVAVMDSEAIATYATNCLNRTQNRSLKLSLWAQLVDSIKGDVSRSEACCDPLLPLEATLSRIKELESPISVLTPNLTSELATDELKRLLEFRCEPAEFEAHQDHDKFNASEAVEWVHTIRFLPGSTSDGDTVIPPAAICLSGWVPQ